MDIRTVEDIAQSRRLLDTRLAALKAINEKFRHEPQSQLLQLRAGTRYGGGSYDPNWVEVSLGAELASAILPELEHEIAKVQSEIDAIDARLETWE